MIRRAARTRMVGHVARTRASRVRGEQVVHDDIAWTVFQVDKLPAGYFGAWALIDTDGDRFRVVEFVGTGSADAIRHAAKVRAHVWSTRTVGHLRVGVADPAAFGTRFRPQWGAGSR